MLPRAAIAVCLGATLASGCQAAAGDDAAPPARAFYYWRTTFELSAAEQRALADLDVARLYVRAFDVDWSEARRAPAVIAEIAIASGQRVPSGIDVVPVVFLTNELFRRLPATEVPALAALVWDQARARADRFGARPRELQIDCDWSDSTRDRFFAFAGELRRLTGGDRVALSATIRLHQIKYRERTGVPPVDRGMLMFYNMGRFGPDDGDRAIFDPRSAARYLDRIGDYPLPLDVALPIWSWVLHLRDGAVHDLLQSADPDQLSAVPLLARAGPDRYRAIRTGFWRGSLLREGDELKVEAIGPADSLAAARLVAGRLDSRARTVSLFDLSERNVTRHGIASLEQVFGAVR